MSRAVRLSTSLQGLALASFPVAFLLQALWLWKGDAARAEQIFIVLTCAAACETVVASLLYARRGGTAWRGIGLAVALSLWIGGQIATLYEGSVAGTDGNLQWSVLLFSLFGMPILALAATTRASHPSRATYYLDAVTLAALTYAFLTYNADVVSTRVIDAQHAFDLISRNFALEGLVLAIVSLGRLFSAESQEDWGFFFVLSEFLVIDLIAATAFNYGGADAQSLAVRILAYGLMTAPFLLLAWRLAGPLPRGAIVPRLRPPARAMLLSLGPSLLTISLVLLVVQILPAHAALGALLLFLAIASYIARNMITQSWYLQNRDALMADAHELRTMARTDPLTGVGNRRLFDEALAAEWERARRTESPLALLLIDVDAFKAYNDTYGHEAGDHCLQRIALALRVALPRTGDVIARYGGEEFAVLLPNTSEAAAQVVADRLHAQLAALALEHSASVYGVVTISIGLSAMRPTRDTLEHTLVRAADRALYAAKDAGRHRTIVDTRDDEPAAHQPTSVDHAV